MYCNHSDDFYNEHFTQCDNTLIRVGFFFRSYCSPGSRCHCRHIWSWECLPPPHPLRCGFYTIGSCHQGSGRVQRLQGRSGSDCRLPWKALELANVPVAAANGERAPSGSRNSRETHRSTEVLIDVFNQLAIMAAARHAPKERTKRTALSSSLYHSPSHP